MKKQQPIASDEPQIERLTVMLKRVDKCIVSFKDEFNQLPPAEFIKSHADLIIALNDPTDFYKACIMARIPDQDITGLPINKRKTLETLSLPDLSKVEGLKNEVETIMRVTNADLAKLYPGPEMKQDAEYAESLKDAYRLFANDEVEIKLVQTHEELVRAFLIAKEHFEKHYSHSFFTPNQFDIYTIIKDGKFNAERLKASRSFRI